MATKLYFSAKEQILGSSLVQSDTETVPASMPELVIGDQVPLEIYIVDGDGGFMPFSGSGSYSIKLGIGTPGAVASGGTFTLTYDGQTTAALAYDATAAQVQAALEALSNIAPGDVLVTEVNSGWLVEFIGTKAATDVVEMTGNASLLTPESTVTVSTVQEGDNSPAVNEQQLIVLTRRPAAYLDDFDTITDGWEGVLNMNTRGIFDALAGAASVTLYCELEVTDNLGQRRTYGQVQVLVRNQVVNNADLQPTPKANYYTQQEIDDIFAGLTDAYVYIAYADDDDGTGFTNTFNASKAYIAILTTDTEIVSPIAGDFAGLWKRYEGGRVYIAYASDDTGTDFTTTFDPDLNFIAIKASLTALTPVSGDFTGLWHKYGGAKRWRQRDARAFAFMPALTNGPTPGTQEIGAEKVMLDVLWFDGATEQSAQINFSFPDIWDLSTIKGMIYWTPDAGASSGDKVTFGISAMSAGDNEDINTAFGTEILVKDTVLAVGKVHKTPFSAAITIAGSPAARDLVWLKVARKTGNADDTMVQRAGLIALNIGWREAANEPAVW